MLPGLLRLNHSPALLSRLLPARRFAASTAMSADLIARLAALSIDVPASSVVEHGPVQGAKAWREALAGKEGVPAECERIHSHIRRGGSEID